MFIPKNGAPFGPHRPLQPHPSHHHPVHGVPMPPARRPGWAPLPGGGTELAHLPTRFGQPGHSVDRGFFTAMRGVLPLPRQDAPWSMPPPFRLRDALSSRPNTVYMQYARAVDQSIRAHSLSHLSRHMTDANLIGKGSSKDCYRLDSTKVLVVAERSGNSISSELVTHQILKSAGFPMVKILDAGTLPSRYPNGNGSVSRQSAMTQERLGGFIKFERFASEDRRNLLNSPRLNQNTLDSLLTIRHLIRKEGVCIGDLQGGLRKNGVFALTDATHLSRLSDANPFQKAALKNLDRTIRDVAARLRG